MIIKSFQTSSCIIIIHYMVDHLISLHRMSQVALPHEGPLMFSFNDFFNTELNKLTIQEDGIKCCIRKMSFSHTSFCLYSINEAVIQKCQSIFKGRFHTDSDIVHQKHKLALDSSSEDIKKMYNKTRFITNVKTNNFGNVISDYLHKKHLGEENNPEEHICTHQSLLNI